MKSTDQKLLEEAYDKIVLNEKGIKPALVAGILALAGLTNTSAQNHENVVWDSSSNKYVNKAEYLKSTKTGIEDLDKTSEFMFDDKIAEGSLIDYLEQPAKSMMPEEWLQKAVVSLKHEFDKQFKQNPDWFKVDDGSDPFIAVLNGAAESIGKELSEIAKDKNSLAYSIQITYNLTQGNGIIANLFQQLKNKSKQLESHSSDSTFSISQLDKYISGLDKGSEATAGSNWTPSKGIHWFLTNLKSLNEYQREIYINQLVKKIQNAKPDTFAYMLKQTYSEQPNMKQYFKNYITSLKSI